MKKIILILLIPMTSLQAMSGGRQAKIIRPLMVSSKRHVGSDALSGFASVSGALSIHLKKLHDPAGKYFETMAQINRDMRINGYVPSHDEDKYISQAQRDVSDKNYPELLKQAKKLDAVSREALHECCKSFEMLALHSSPHDKKIYLDSVKRCKEAFLHLDNTDLS